jgi:hypothetical protein
MNDKKIDNSGNITVTCKDLTSGLSIYNTSNITTFDLSTKYVNNKVAIMEYAILNIFNIQKLGEHYFFYDIKKIIDSLTLDIISHKKNMNIEIRNKKNQSFYKIKIVGMLQYSIDNVYCIFTMMNTIDDMLRRLKKVYNFVGDGSFSYNEKKIDSSFLFSKCNFDDSVLNIIEFEKHDLNLPNKIYKKKPIPSALRKAVWKRYFKDSDNGLCVCCNTQEINIYRFDCGHVISEKNGGPAEILNLRPICQTCNSSMRTENMDDFIKRCGFDKLKNVINADKNISVKKYVCKYCNAEFAQHEGLSRHINHRCKLKDTKEGKLIELAKKKNMESTSVETIKRETDRPSDNVVLLEVINLASRLEKIETSLDSINKFNKIKSNINIFKYAAKTFKNSPSIMPISRKNIIDTLIHIQKIKSDCPAEKYILREYKKKKLIDFIGNVMIQNYKKENPKCQSLWVADREKLVFIIKIGKNWIKDEEGIKTMSHIINPLCEEILEILKLYILEIDKKIIKKEIDDDKCTKLKKEETIAFSARYLLTTKKFRKKVMKYIVPHFEFDVILDKIMSDFDSPESESDDEINYSSENSSEYNSSDSSDSGL